MSARTWDKANRSSRNLCVHGRELECDFSRRKSVRASPEHLIALQFHLPFKAGAFSYSPSNRHVSVEFNRDPGGFICFGTIKLFFCGSIAGHCAEQ